MPAPHCIVNVTVQVRFLDSVNFSFISTVAFSTRFGLASKILLILLAELNYSYFQLRLLFALNLTFARMNNRIEEKKAQTMQ